MLAGAGLDNVLLIVAGVLAAILSVLVMRRYRDGNQKRHDLHGRYPK